LKASFISGVAVALFIGLAIGSLAIPRTVTQTTTAIQATTATATQTRTTTFTYQLVAVPPVVIFTVQTVLLVYNVGKCTTVSGTPMVTYYQPEANQLTTVATTYHTSLPSQQVYISMTTNNTLVVSEVTQPFSGSC
jgi:hypothetical protein